MIMPLNAASPKEAASAPTKATTKRDSSTNSKHEASKPMSLVKRPTVPSMAVPPAVKATPKASSAAKSSMSLRPLAAYVKSVIVA